MIVNLDLDDAFAARIEAAARARGVSVRDFIRAALVLALEVPAPATASRSAFVQRTHDFGAHNDTTWTLLAEIESNDYLGNSGHK